jgi:hypothetical protein
MTLLTEKISRFVFLGPNEHVLAAVPTKAHSAGDSTVGSPKRRRSASAIWGPICGGAAVGFATGGQADPGVTVLAAAGGGALGLVIGGAIDSRRSRHGPQERPEPNEFAPVASALAVTESRLLLVELSPDGRGLCVTDEPINSVASVTATPNKRLGLVVSTDLAVKLRDGRPPIEARTLVAGKRLHQLLGALQFNSSAPS